MGVGRGILVGMLALGRVGTHWSRTGPLNPTHFWHWKRPCGSIFALIASSLARPSVPQTPSCNERHCSSFSACVSVIGQSLSCAAMVGARFAGARYRLSVRTRCRIRTFISLLLVHPSPKPE